MKGIAPGYNINPMTATPEELMAFLEKSRGKFSKSNAQRLAAKNNPWQSMRATAATHAEPYDNLFRGMESLYKDPSYGISKVGGGFDYSNANWDAIRPQIQSAGETWNKNAASRNSGNIFAGPLSVAASFGLPLLGVGLGAGLLGKFAPFAKAAGIASGSLFGKSGASSGGRFNTPSQTIGTIGQRGILGQK